MQAVIAGAHSNPNYPKFRILTSGCGSEVYESDTPDCVLDRVPYANGPGDTKPYLARIDNTYHVLGILDVYYNEKHGNSVYPDKDVVHAACEKATALIRAQAPMGTLVYPCDVDSWPGRCIICVAIPLNEHTAEQVKAKLSIVFQHYALISNVLSLAA